MNSVHSVRHRFVRRPDLRLRRMSGTTGCGAALGAVADVRKGPITKPNPLGMVPPRPGLYTGGLAQDFASETGFHRGIHFAQNAI